MARLFFASLIYHRSVLPPSRPADHGFWIVCLCRLSRPYQRQSLRLNALRLGPCSFLFVFDLPGSPTDAKPQTIASGAARSVRRATRPLYLQLRPTRRSCMLARSCTSSRLSSRLSSAVFGCPSRPSQHGHRLQ